MQGLRRGSSWTWFWLAHRKGAGGWAEATTAREAIRKATLLAPGKAAPWLQEAAADAERRILAAADEGEPAGDGEQPPPA
jgi:hypothetical protein